MTSVNNKRIFDEAFERKELKDVKINDFYVEHTVYKVLKCVNETEADPIYCIKTAENHVFDYSKSIILNTASAATSYVNEVKATKTELIKLFSNLSLNDIWFAIYYIKDKDNSWQEEMVEKIQSMDKVNALQFVKNNFNTFGKVKRELIGQKVHLNSNNNYYVVKDLNIHFDELSFGTEPSLASKISIRNLDVNKLECLIFNGVKYTRK